MKTFLNLTTADIVLIFLVLAASAVSAFAVPRWLSNGATEIEVYSDNQLVGRYPLNRDRTISAKGTVGITNIEIKNGHARIKESSCRNKTCMRMGELGSSGGFLLCLPNGILVKVGVERSDNLDAVSR
jgi:hypothetical protein